MATTVTQATHITLGVERFYVRTMLKAARPLLLHTKWGQVKDIPANNTDVIRFRRYSLLAAATTALTEGTTPAGKTVTVTNIGGTVLQYGRNVIAVLKSFLDNLGTLDRISSMVVS